MIFQTLQQLYLHKTQPAIRFQLILFLEWYIELLKYVVQFTRWVSVKDG